MPISVELAIEGGEVVEPGFGVFVADIGCSDGKISVIAEPGTISGARETISAKGLHLLPGVFDPHIHAGIYQDLESDALSETKAALSGGVTTVGVYIHADGGYDDILPDMARTYARQIVADVKIHATIDKRHIPDIPTLSGQYGINSFKFYLAGIEGVLDPIDDAGLLAGFRQIAMLDGHHIACVHAENADIVDAETSRVRHGIDAPDLLDWESTRPGFCEAEAISRAIFLARQAGCLLYVVHVSSAAGARVLKTLRPDPGFVETTSPYLTCAIEDYDRRDLFAKHLPPLRRRTELAELWDAVADDRIDTIGTDHIAVSRGAKTAADSILDMITAGPFLETHVPAVLTTGLQRGIPLERLVAKLTANPARAFGLYPSKGSLRIGSDADITLVDLGTEREVRSSKFPGSSDFSLVEGKKFIGWPEIVVKDGRIAYWEGNVMLSPGSGRILSPELQAL